MPVAAVLAFGAWQISAGGPVSPRPASSSLSPPPARTLTQKGGSPSLDRMSLEVQEGDTFGKLLDRAGVAATEREAVIRSMTPHWRPESLRPGQRLDLELRPAAFGSPLPRLASLRLSVEFGKELEVLPEPARGFRARVRQHRLDSVPVTARGRIVTSLFSAGRAAGVPAGVLTEMIHAFSYQVDFQRDLREGDGFLVLYQRLRDEETGASRDGSLLFASLSLSGREVSFYRHSVPWSAATVRGQPAHPGYYDTEGASVRKTLMRTPIDGARLTSTYGRRRHPVLGYSRMHRGIDFGARRGTPIYAAGSGVVTRAERSSSYGRFVKLRHGGGFETLYAHMSRFARGLHRGVRVEQGQVIGYVGASGRATGPHLHYEVFKGGRRVNPLTVELPSGRHLEGEELAAFHRERRWIDALHRDASGGWSRCSLP